MIFYRLRPACFLKFKKTGSALGRILGCHFFVFDAKVSAGLSAQPSVSGFSVFQFSLSQPEHSVTVSC